MANETLRCPGEIVETDAEANLLNHFVGIFGIDVVFNSLHALLVEVLGGDLDQIRNFCLDTIIRFTRRPQDW